MTTLAEIKARCEKATEGPWSPHEFLHMPDIPYLLSLIERCRESVAHELYLRRISQQRPGIDAGNIARIAELEQLLREIGE